jgi:putative CocE/NonD family hydrolase
VKPPAAEEGFDSLVAEPAAGTGSKSRWRTLTLSVKGARLYPGRKSRDRALLCYTSAPLERDLEVTGHPLMCLHISADRRDAALFVYLEDVDEGGRVTMVTEGQLRALHRKLSGTRLPGGPLSGRSFLREHAQPLVPGEVAELVFDLIPTSYLFRKGHALRIALAGGDADHFEPLPGDPPVLRVHRSAGAPSRVELPVVDEEAL